MRVGLIGTGFVGSALQKSFESRGQVVVAFDKFKNIGKIEDVLDTDVVFLCLPSLFIEGYGYDLTAIQENCRKLSQQKYSGLVVLKSTVEPGTTKFLAETFKLNMAYNPEFLTARTAFDDFDSQKHIVIGFNEIEPTELINLFSTLYPQAVISKSNTTEAETMKVFCNCFYAAKVMIFNEYYLMCQKLGLDFELVKEMMLKNGWINPMHTSVPGPDGKFAYGGACFPKDTGALNYFMSKLGTPHEVLEAAIKERNKIRGE